MRLVSWNLNGRRADVPAQVAAIAERGPDVVALQEVTRGSAPLLRDALAATGLTFAIASFELAPDVSLLTGPRRYGLLVASRFPLVAEPPGRFRVPWPERVLSVVVTVAGRQLELHDTHVPPGSSNGWVKVEHLEGLYDALARESPIARVLCGDFNTPQTEGPNGEVVTWAQRRRRNGEWRVAGTLRRGSGARWDAAERAVLTGLARWDLADTFRTLHGYVRSEESWLLRQRGRGVGRRFDHVFASACLRPVRCRYVHEWREHGLSDHSAVEVDFDWPPSGQ